MKTVWMKSPTGSVRKVQGERMADTLQAQGWTTTDERPKAKATSRKPGSYYVNASNLPGW